MLSLIFFSVLSLVKFMDDRKIIYAVIGLAIVAIFLLEIVAMSLGFNGTILKISLTSIGVLGGYVGRDLKVKRNGDNKK